MRRSALAFAAVVAALPCSLTAQSNTADSVAVLRVIAQRMEAMRAHRAEAQRPNYAVDAVWLNAFGRRHTGADSIVAFLGRLYADSGYRESRLVDEATPEVLFVRPDVAIVHAFHQREGQRLADGSVVDRRVHTTLVLSKEQGQWLIRYEHIADERPRPTPH